VNNTKKEAYMHVIIDNFIAIHEAPLEIVNEVKKTFTIDNPEWLENDRMGRWNGETPQRLKFWRIEDGALILPRATIGLVIDMARRNGHHYHVEDNRRLLPSVEFTFKGKLRGYQLAAVADLGRRDFGTLQAPTGSGKTIIALAMIAWRKQPTLIIVHSKELLEQWKARIIEFLGIPCEQIGTIGNGKMQVGEKITVGIVNSVYKLAGEIRDRIGHLVIDECHRAPSRTFTECVTGFDAKYQLGLSATPWRRDGLTRLIWWFVGNTLHRIEASGLVESGDILPFRVILRETRFIPSCDPSEEYSRMLSELTEDPARNALIAADIAGEIENPGTILILSDRRAHCLQLKDCLAERNIKAEMLTGEMSASVRSDIVRRLNDGDIKVLIATAQLIGEGFDCKGLTTLFLATPIRFDGKLLQCLGRVLRPALGKDKAVVYDYCDSRVGVLRSAARARERVYQAAM
jgi:superfamily II DNA or RNA helicase